MRAALLTFLLGGCLFISAEDRAQRAELLGSSSGDDDDGVVGDDDDDDVLTGDDDDDVSTALAGNWAQVSVGSETTCALDTDGAVSCWGSALSTLSELPSGTGWLGVAAGLRQVCVWSATDVVCKGEDELEMEAVPAWISEVDEVVTGSALACARYDGGLECWGRDSDSILIQGFVADVSAASVTENVCAVVGGALTCWGHSGSATGRTPKGSVADVGNMVQVDMGSGLSACAIDTDGRFVSWNTKFDTVGFEGDATGWTQLVAAEGACCGLTATGRLACEGSPAGFGGLPGGTWRSWSATNGVACAIDAADQMTCWGSGGHLPE